MSKFELSLPKKRKYIHQQKEAPFPIPVESQTYLPATPERWQHFTAHIVKGGIFVDDQSDIQCLYTMGFFGKGTLSRHKPNYSQRQPVVKTKNKSGNCTNLNLMTRRKYLYHRVWANQFQEGGFDELPVLRVSRGNEGNATGQCSAPTLVPNKQCTDSDIDLKRQSCEQADTTGESLKPEENPWVADSKNTTNGATYDPWAETTQTEAEDFWGVCSSSEQTNTVPEESTSCSDSKLPKDSGESSAKEESDAQNLPSLSQRSPSTRIAHKKKKPENPVGTEMKWCTTESSSADVPIVKVLEPDNNFRDNDGRKTVTTCTSIVQDPSTSKTGDTKAESSLVDDLCGQPDPNGDLLVVEDTDDSDVDQKLDPKTKWRSVIKKQPHHLQESLELSMEEAYFLSYALGCLVVFDENEEALDLEALWQRFGRQDSHFICRYSVYHNFRSKGWVPKSGLKYGTDFVVYKDGPAFYHSTLSVIVIPVDENTLNAKDDAINRMKTWTDLAAMNRVTEQVSKDLMLCYVVQPTVNDNDDFWSTPTCLTSLKIQEVVVRRWISKHERENAEFVLIP